jgi:hypothetical protein
MKKTVLTEMRNQSIGTPTFFFIDVTGVTPSTTASQSAKMEHLSKSQTLQGINSSIKESINEIKSNKMASNNRLYWSPLFLTLQSISKEQSLRLTG